MHFVDTAAGMEVDRSRINPGIGPQQRHADALEIPVDERPEAPVRVSVFGADARMQNKGADARQRENLGPEDDLAARDGDIGLQPRQELTRGLRVRTRHDDLRHRCEVCGIGRAHPPDGVFSPRRVLSGEAETRIRSERHDIREPQQTDPPNLAPRGAPQPPRPVTDEDETSQFQCARQPRRERLAVEPILLVTDEHSCW